MSIDSNYNEIKLIILDLLSLKEFQSGQKLYDDLKYKFYHNNIFSIDYKKINSSDELFKVLEWIKTQVRNKAFYPWIHFEAHGNIDGLMITGHDKILWKEILLWLKEINILLLNSLIIVMSACKGATLIYKIDYWDRAPFLLVIGPEYDLNVGELYDGFYDFYNNFFFNFDFNNAHNMLMQNIKTISDTITMVRVDTCFDIYTSFNEKSENFEKIIEPYRLIYLQQHPSIRFETREFQQKEAMRGLKITLDNLKKNKPYFMMEDLKGTSPNTL